MNPDSAAQMSFDVPVLLITWRRPDTTRQVIDAMRAAAPSRVFVASDGPRTPEEAIKVQATRELVASAIDWPCEIQTCYSSSNQGCRQGVSSAITWFFQQVEEGIILEDDCVPHPHFFEYCRELLKRYRHDLRVWCIGGSNFQDGQVRGDGSYYFSRYNHCWGWASWKRCWSHYDQNMPSFNSFLMQGLKDKFFSNPREANYWHAIWQRLVQSGEPNTWDYQWLYTCVVNSGLTALPNCNLVQNIGAGEDATHTVEHVQSVPLDSQGLDSLIHPKFVYRDVDADHYTFQNHYGGLDLERQSTWHYQVRSKLMIAITKPTYYPRKISQKLSEAIWP